MASIRARAGRVPRRAARDHALDGRTARRDRPQSRPRQFLTPLRRAAFTDEGTLLFVNAGIDAEKPLDLQGDAFWWGGADILDLTAPYAGFRRVVRGYDRRHAGFIESEYAVSLDAGSGFGGRFFAACLRRTDASSTASRVNSPAASTTLTGAGAKCNAAVGKYRSEPRIPRQKPIARMAIHSSQVPRSSK